jgi:hypothetical protein
MNVIFVFGSNLAGIHGAGAALHAKKYWGAKPGVGSGLTGSAYALPTKDENLQTLSLAQIELNVIKFKIFARKNPTVYFLTTAIGCGLAGFSPNQIRPFFVDSPQNLYLSGDLLKDLWRPIIGD